MHLIAEILLVLYAKAFVRYRDNGLVICKDRVGLF